MASPARSNGADDSGLVKIFTTAAVMSGQESLGESGTLLQGSSNLTACKITITMFREASPIEVGYKVIFDISIAGFHIYTRARFQT